MKCTKRMQKSDLIRYLDQMYITGRTKVRIVVDVYSCDGHWKETINGTCDEVLDHLLDNHHHSKRFTVTVN